MRRLLSRILLLGITFSNECLGQLIPNGSFENGTLPTSSPGFPETLDPSTAIPGWSISGSPLYFQSGPLGGPAIAITTAYPASNGSNSVYLQAGFGGATTPVALWQSLLIPLNVKAITFQAKELYDPNLYPGMYYLALLVSVAGQSVSPIYLSTNGSGFKMFAMDVTPYSGTSVELRFSVDPLGDPARGGAYQIDDLRYSSTPVPEPSTLALLGFGATALCLQGGRKSHRRRFGFMQYFRIS